MRTAFESFDSFCYRILKCAVIEEEHARLDWARTYISKKLQDFIPSSMIEDDKLLIDMFKEKWTGLKDKLISDGLMEAVNLQILDQHLQNCAVHYQKKMIERIAVGVDLYEH